MVLSVAEGALCGVELTSEYLFSKIADFQLTALVFSDLSGGP